ncbi:peptidase [Rathayibacter caricis DSM 15933]|uniref:Peptidase n=1 Tax=Rathayibacter caricis DSM 15933 TaxID=1328867 RepID=A0A2T4USN5_9MICO|nr:peptidase [Rathayibacter caricis]PTL72521.1 peptidase [Rathayibacter caricis DSM 15933]
MTRAAHRAARLRPPRRHRTLLAAGLATALVLAGTATATALFTSRDSVQARTSSGVVTLSFTATTATAVPVAVTGLVPGGTARRLVDLTNAGSVAVSALQLESAAPVVGASPSDGLQIALDRCSQPWSSDGATCGGTITAVSPDRPATARIDLPASPALANGVTDHLRLTLRLPESAPSAAQGTTGSITLTAVGVQRPGRHV